MLRIGVAFDAILVRTRANGWAITALPFWGRTVNFHEHRIVNIAAERAFCARASMRCSLATFLAVRRPLEFSCRLSRSFDFLLQNMV
jgi:hypothetical protein